MGSSSYERSISLLKKYGLFGDTRFRYQMLDRLRMDCNYYLDRGGKVSNVLWANDEKLHIELMKALYRSFRGSEKPQWISMQEIKGYEKLMMSRVRGDVAHISKFSKY